VGITFDDGYLNNLTHALPVLQRCGFSATCYIVSRRIGQTNAWDAEKGIAATPLMNAGQILQWCAGGQEIGAHSRTHGNLTMLDIPSSFDEIEGSKADLEDLTGRPVFHFCYPFGDYGNLQVLQVIESGYLTATTTARGRALPGCSLLELPRVPVVRSTLLPALMLKVATRYEDRPRE
jgi:peptidoglycan/xylan/chitin deacetylase (PgdA/CDA1 family)